MSRKIKRMYASSREVYSTNALGEDVTEYHPVIIATASEESYINTNVKFSRESEAMAYAQGQCDVLEASLVHSIEVFGYTSELDPDDDIEMSTKALINS